MEFLKIANNILSGEMKEKKLMIVFGGLATVRRALNKSYCREHILCKHKHKI